MYLKIMSQEALPDGDSNKSHTLVEVGEYFMDRETEDLDLSSPLIIRYWLNGEQHARRVHTNIYVMNGEGKTIATIYPTRGTPQ